MDHSSERQDGRVVAAVGIIVTIDGQAEPCVTRNISRGGLFAVTRRKVEPGSIVQVDIVQGGRHLTSTARVSTCTDAGIGVTFIGGGPVFEREVAVLMAELLARGKGVQEAHGLVDERTRARFAWAYLPDGRVWNPWHTRRHRVGLLSLSLDGAAVASRSRPPLGRTILVYLRDPDAPRRHGIFHCRARVVRHTERGFAVRFVSPRLPFRQIIARLRRSS